MAIAYLSLIKHALAEGKYLTVFDGEEYIVCDGYQAAKTAIEDVEEARLEIYADKERKQYMCYAYVLPYGVGPEESVADYSVPVVTDELPKDHPGLFVDNWFNTFFEEHG